MRDAPAMMIWFPRSHDLPNPALSPTNAGHPAPQTGKTLTYLFSMFVPFLSRVYKMFSENSGCFQEIHSKFIRKTPRILTHPAQMRQNAPCRLPHAHFSDILYPKTRPIMHGRDFYVLAAGNSRTIHERAAALPHGRVLFFGLADCSKKSCALCRICRLWNRFLRPIIKP